MNYCRGSFSLVMQGKNDKLTSKRKRPADGDGRASTYSGKLYILARRRGKSSLKANQADRAWGGVSH